MRLAKVDRPHELRFGVDQRAEASGCKRANAVDSARLRARLAAAGALCPGGRATCTRERNERHRGAMGRSHDTPCCRMQTAEQLLLAPRYELSPKLPERILSSRARITDELRERVLSSRTWSARACTVK